MQIIILHSQYSPLSLALLESMGILPDGADMTITHEEREVRIISEHAQAVAACPNFSAYPAIVVQDGASVRVKSPVESWAECQDFVDNPPTSEAPAPKIEFTRLEFLNLFTGEEQVALKAAESNPAVGVFWESWRAADCIRLDDSRTIAAVSMLATPEIGIITPARAAAILEG